MDFFRKSWQTWLVFFLLVPLNEIGAEPVEINDSHIHIEGETMRQRFDSWKDKWKVSYKTEKEDEVALDNFIFNWEVVNEVNNRKNISFKLSSDGPFMDRREGSALSPEGLGLLIPSFFHETLLLQQNTERGRFFGYYRGSQNLLGDKDGDMDSIDWVDKGNVSPVKNQLACGSCWAFSAAGALEGQWSLLNPHDQKQILSVQQFVDCDTSNNGCYGGLMSAAFMFAAVHGVESWRSYDYVGKEGKCRQTDESKDMVIPPYKVVGYGVVVSEEGALASALLNIGPISVAVNASKPVFQHYDHGILDHPSCYNVELDHGVLAVGYGYETQDNGKEIKYWKVKNSWGTDWGEKGYIRLARDINVEGGECGILLMSSFPILEGASWSDPSQWGDSSAEILV